MNGNPKHLIPLQLTEDNRASFSQLIMHAVCATAYEWTPNRMEAVRQSEFPLSRNDLQHPAVAPRAWLDQKLSALEGLYTYAEPPSLAKVPLLPV